MKNNNQPWLVMQVSGINDSKRDSLRYGAALFAVVLIAIAFRLVFFMGFVAADPQDDGIYINEINRMVNGTYSLAPLRKVLADNKLDPAHSFQLRMAFLVPERLSVKFFGHSDFSYTLFPFLCSIGCVVLCYFFFSQTGANKTIGLIAAFLLAVCPLDCAFSTKISPDIPLALFIGLTVFYFLRGEIQSRDKNSPRGAMLSFFMSGVFFSIASGIKIMGVILPAFFLLYFLINRRPNRLHLFILLGYMPFFIALSYYYYINTGYFFLMNIVSTKSQLFNFNVGGWFPCQRKFGNLEIKSYYGGLFELTKLTLAFKTYFIGGTHYFTVYYHMMLIGAVIWIARMRKRLTPETNRVISICLIWAVGGFLLVEFAPVSIKEILVNRSYCIFPKAPRFLTYISIPVASVAALCLYSLRDRKRIVYCVLMAIALSSVICMNQIRNTYRDGIADIEVLTDYVKKHPEKTYYVDYLAKGLLLYQVQYNPNIKIENVGMLKTPSDLGQGILVLGGARGVEVFGDSILNIVPEWVKSLTLGNRDGNLVCIREMNHNRPGDQFYRKHNMKLFIYKPAI